MRKARLAKNGKSLLSVFALGSLCAAFSSTGVYSLLVELMLVINKN